MRPRATGFHVLRAGFAAALLASPAARAATLAVTSLADSGAGTLRAQITAASAGDTIIFSLSGTITLTTGVLSLSQNLAIDGSGQAVAVDGGNATRIFDVASPAVVTLKSLTLQHASVSGSNGGAITVASGAALTIDTCTLTANTSTTSSGGALANLGTTTIVNSTISANTTGAGGGGAVYSNGAMTVAASTVTGNSAPNDGGAFYNDANGTLVITGSTFSGNSASAFGGGGGALATRGSTTITASTFNGNSAVGYGGAIRADTSGGPPGFGKLDVVNSTFSANATNGTAGGGAIGSVNAGTVRLFNVTVATNSALGSSFGGGIYAGGGTTLQSENSILSGNTAPAGNGQDCTGTISSLGYNLVSSLEACTVAGTLTGNVTGASASLGPLANNGGPTQTMALTAGSPAIDAGDPAGCVDQTGAALTVDQRGLPRPSGVRCDMGACAFAIAGQPAGPALGIDDPGSAVAGHTLTYSLSFLYSGGTAATSVVLRDTVPVGTTFVSATGGGALSAGDVVWNVPTLGAGVTGQTVSFTVTVNASSGSVTNTTYSIAATGISPVAGAPVSTAVQPAGGGPGGANAVPALSPIALAALAALLATLGLAALKKTS